MIEPRSGRSRPISDFKKTDLPVPDGPSNTLTSPSGTSIVTSSQIRWEPKDFVSPSTWIPIPITTTALRETPSAARLNCDSGVARRGISLLVRHCYRRRARSLPASPERAQFALLLGAGIRLSVARQRPTRCSRQGGGGEPKAKNHHGHDDRPSLESNTYGNRCIAQLHEVEHHVTNLDRSDRKNSDDRDGGAEQIFRKSPCRHASQRHQAQPHSGDPFAQHRHQTALCR